MSENNKNDKYQGQRYADWHTEERPLPEGAKPTEWGSLSPGQLEAEIKKHRWMHCEHYQVCLDYSALLRWLGWSCHWCPLNPFGTEGTREAQIEAERLHLLIQQESKPYALRRLKRLLKKWTVENENKT